MCEFDCYLPWLTAVFLVVCLWPVLVCSRPSIPKIVISGQFIWKFSHLLGFLVFFCVCLFVFSCNHFAVYRVSA